MLQMGFSLQEFVVAGGVVIALAILLAVFGMFQAFRAHVDHHGLIPVLWRWFSGSHHHKQDPYSRLSPDRHRPHCKRRLSGRMRRVLWRTAGVFFIPWYLFAWFIDTTGIWLVTSIVTLALAGELVRHLWLTKKDKQHHRLFVRPIGETARQILHPEVMPGNVGEWVTVDADYRKKRDVETEQAPHPHFAIVDLPRYWNGSDRHKERLANIIKQTCGMDETASVTWHLTSLESSVEVRDLQPPPRHVTLRDIEPEIERLEIEDGAVMRQIALGLGRANAAVSVSLDQDSPNIGLSIGAGGGKSQIARLVASQVLHRGGVVLILDVKRISHAWARGLPNVRYAKTIEEIHEALLDLSYEVDRRTEMADRLADNEGNLPESIRWPRWLVIVEESNEMMERLRRYWQNTRDPRKDPQISPAILAYQECLFMGRQLLINMLAVAQMMTARASGSGAARENMGVRILGRFSRNNWRMLAPEFDQPMRSMHPGRVQVVTTEVRECQVAFISAEETIQYATNGVVTAFPNIDRDGVVAEDSDVIEGEVVDDGDLGHPENAIPAIMPPTRETTWVSPDHDPVADPDWVPLRACLENLPGKTIDMLRNDAKRDPRFPRPHPRKQGRDNLYPADDIMRYYANKNGNGRVA